LGCFGSTSARVGRAVRGTGQLAVAVGLWEMDFLAKLDAPKKWVPYKITEIKAGRDRLHTKSSPQNHFLHNEVFKGKFFPEEVGRYIWERSGRPAGVIWQSRHGFTPGALPTSIFATVSSRPWVVPRLFSRRAPRLGMVVPLQVGWPLRGEGSGGPLRSPAPVGCVDC
jgi:hypothetical protein